MKLTSLQFIMIVTTLVMVAGSAYKAGQSSRPTRIVITPPPATVAAPLPGPKVNDKPRRLIFRTGGVYFHYTMECTYLGDRTRFRQLQAEHKRILCPRCTGQYAVKR